MKRLLTLAASVAFAWSLSACGTQGTTTNNETSQTAEEESTAREYTQYEINGVSFDVPSDWELTKDDDSHLTWRCVEADHAASFTAYYSPWSDYDADVDAGTGEALIDFMNANALVGDYVIAGSGTYEETTVDGLPSRLMTYHMNSDGESTNIQSDIVMADGFVGFAGSVYHYSELQDELSEEFKHIIDTAEVDKESMKAYKEAYSNSSFSTEDIALLEEHAKQNISDALEGHKTWGTDSSTSSDDDGGDSDSNNDSTSSYSNVYDPGVYLVGSDLPAGEYALVVKRGTHAYYCVYPDTSKSDILENNNFDILEYTTVSDGQLIEVNAASLVPADEYVDDRGPAGSGRWRVGIDIPEGTYKLELLSGETHGYYAVYNSSLPGADIEQNNNFTSNDYVTVSNGQYLELNNCLANPQK